jgi:hypothetical protein
LTEYGNNQAGASAGTVKDDASPVIVPPAGNPYR